MVYTKYQYDRCSYTPPSSYVTNLFHHSQTQTWPSEQCIQDQLPTYFCKVSKNRMLERTGFSNDRYDGRCMISLSVVRFTVCPMNTSIMYEQNRGNLKRFKIDWFAHLRVCIVFSRGVLSNFQALDHEKISRFSRSMLILTCSYCHNLHRELGYGSHSTPFTKQSHRKILNDSCRLHTNLWCPPGPHVCRQSSTYKSSHNIICAQDPDTYYCMYCTSYSRTMEYSQPPTQGSEARFLQSTVHFICLSPQTAPIIINPSLLDVRYDTIWWIYEYHDHHDDHNDRRSLPSYVWRNDQICCVTR